MSDTFHYKVPWPVPGFRQGDHNSSSTGDTGAYRADRLLRDAADARRLALRTSVRDPFSRWWVREYLHHATLNLWVMADVSASMRNASSCQTMASLIRASALSSRRIGDRFGLICAAEQIDERLSLRASLNRGAATRLADEVGDLPGQAPRIGIGDVQGLLTGATRLGHQRSLVFLASDFHAPDERWHDIFHALRRHLVVPIVIWHMPELYALDQRGLVNITDAESGQTRLLWMRAGLRRQIQLRIEQRVDQAKALFARHHLRPVTFYDGFDANLLTARFHGAKAESPLPPSFRQ